VSLLVHDLEAAEEFYGTLFGWEFRPQPATALLGRSVLALLDGREVAAIGRPVTNRHLPSAWTTYLASDDVDATAERVRHRGGTVGVGPLDVPSTGRLAVVCDPSGAVFGILRASSAGSPAVRDVPGAPTWIELTTYEPELTAAFYQRVFGHLPQADASAGPGHLTLHLKDGPVASVRDLDATLRPARGAAWMTYFATTDVDAAAERVVRLGGTLLKPPHDGAYGRVVAVADPGGAEFMLVQAPR
jgi:predicted enzyme related to lactoylglutathione lyase